MLRALGSLISIAAVLAILASPGLGSQTEPADLVDSLPTLGTVGPNPINIKVWTNRPPEEKFIAGDRVIIHFTADRPCYVIVVNVSQTGDVAILFPNRENADNFVEADKQYSLFGEHSKVRLVMGKGLMEAKTILFVSSEPVPLEPLQIPDDGLVIKIPRYADADLKVLAEKIDKMASAPGYNRILLTVKGDSSETPDLKLMGPPLHKRVPSKSESDPPETITGSQGIKSKADQ
jgi:hypothetical protein